MTGLPSVALSWDSVHVGGASGRLQRAERTLEHARHKRVEAAQRVGMARRARESAARERADTERWLREARAERQARLRNVVDRAGSLLDAGVADSVPTGRRRPLVFFDADFCMVSDRASIAAALLDAALALSRADRGNVQLFDPDDGVLRIVAQQGFEREFLTYFGVLDDDERSACGLALARRRTVQVDDVTRAAVFDGGLSKDVVLSAGVRAVCSIPLLDEDSGLLGVLSVHYGRPHLPDPVARNILAVLASAGARRLAHPPIRHGSR